MNKTLSPILNNNLQECLKMHGFGIKQNYNLKEIVQYICVYNFNNKIPNIIIKKAIIVDINIYYNNYYYYLKFLDGSGYNSGVHNRNLRPCE